VQATRGCAKVNDDIDETFASVVSAFDELLFVEIFAPLDNVYSGRGKKVEISENVWKIVDI
jgi:hypothetical protein